MHGYSKQKVSIIVTDSRIIVVTKNLLKNLVSKSKDNMNRIWKLMFNNAS